jgi:hypothetical protein
MVTLSPAGSVADGHVDRAATAGVSGAACATVAFAVELRAGSRRISVIQLRFAAGYRCFGISPEVACCRNRCDRLALGGLLRVC